MANNTFRRLHDEGRVVAGTGIVFGWLMSKAWSDPGCQIGMGIFLVTTAVLTLAFALAVVGHGRGPEGPNRDEEDHRDQ
jgi:hypothetical protein